MNGTHRPNGIWIATGEHVRKISPPARLGAVAPWLAGAMGLAWTGTEPAEVARAPLAYDDEEEAMVAERLRALGYLE